MIQRPDSWRDDKFVYRMPAYKNEDEAAGVFDWLKTAPPLVYKGEVDALREELKAAADGRKFVIQGGDCAESFAEFSGDMIRDNYEMMQQLAFHMPSNPAKPVVQIGRIAGQFAKPRTSLEEEQGGVVLPAYMGDIVNGRDFNAKDREPDPKRMRRAYGQAATTLNLLRSFVLGGYGAPEHAEEWLGSYCRDYPQDIGYIAARFRADIANAASTRTRAEGLGYNLQHRLPRYYTSHEALLLPYEEALTRNPRGRANWYNCGAHMLWLGMRTSQKNSAHLHYLRGIKNPVGIKIGQANLGWAVEAIGALQSDVDSDGKVVAICRMGEMDEDTRRRVVSLMSNWGNGVVWMCDPMHANTETTEAGYKTRRMDKIREEIKSFVRLCLEANRPVGGIHLEMTSKPVTECIDEDDVKDGIKAHDVPTRYETHLDPRLNRRQAAMVMSFMAAALLYETVDKRIRDERKNG